MFSARLSSLLAIRRQRRRLKDQRRNKDGSVDKEHHHHPHPRSENKGPSIGMIHIGVVLFVLGLLLVGAGLLPDEITNWSSIGSKARFNELVCTGIAAVVLGVFLIILNHYISKKEDEELDEYVQRQLSTSRSHHGERNLEAAVNEETPFRKEEETSFNDHSNQRHGYVNPYSMNDNHVYERQPDLED